MDMGKMIQLRNVSPELHRKLKSRAALAGMSLSDYLIEIVRRDADKPTLEEFRLRLRSRDAVEVSESAADIIRERRGPI
jgi:plasmid stability protein